MVVVADLVGGFVVDVTDLGFTVVAVTVAKVVGVAPEIVVTVEAPPIVVVVTIGAPEASRCAVGDSPPLTSGALRSSGSTTDCFWLSSTESVFVVVSLPSVAMVIFST